MGLEEAGRGAGARGAAAGAGRHVVVSGARPTGRLHLGNYHGAIKNWIRLQHEQRCLFFVADWHALTTDWASPGDIADATIEMVLDWLALGLDPERCTIFRQSAIPAHAELFLLLGMLVPVPWLERNPTYKEQRAALENRDLSTLGFLGYPVLQAADVLLYKGTAVPVGVDQAPHIELAREIARRFNTTYREVFPEPQTLLTETPKILGTDGRKMSKSYGNAVYLTEEPAAIERKLARMVTDPRRARRSDAGVPEDCPVYTSLHQTYCTADELAWQASGCRAASIGCLECKQVMIAHVLAEAEPIRERRARLTADDARAVLAHGTTVARALAEQTLAEVREAVGL